MASDDLAPGAFPFLGLFAMPYTNIPPIENSVLPAPLVPPNPVVQLPAAPTGHALMPGAVMHLPHLIDRRTMPVPFGFDPLKRVFGGF